MYAGAVVVEQRTKKPEPRPGAKLEQRQAQILHLRRVVGWLRCETDRRRKGVAPTPRQKYILGMLTKMFGDLQSMRKLRAPWERFKGLLKLKAYQARRLRVQLRWKLSKSRYRMLEPKNLQKQ